MNRLAVVIFVLTGLFGTAAVVTATLSVPKPLLVAVGVPIVFLAPGLAFAHGLFRAPRLKEELLLASIGLSVVFATGVAVLLAASIGLSRQSFGTTLGVCTVVLSVSGYVRSARVRDSE